MTNLRRRVPKPVLQVESLDERIAPSVLVGGPVPHAAAAEHSSIKARAIHPRAHRAHHRALLRAGVAPASDSFTYTPSFPAVTATPAPISTPAPSHSDNPAGSLLAASPTLNASGSASASAQASSSGSALPSGESNLTTTPTSTVTTTTTVAPSATTTATPTAPDANQIKNGPLAKAGQTLITLYNQVQSGGVESAKAILGDQVDIQGSSVRVSVQATGANLSSVAASMGQLGMQISATDANSGTVEGLLPIAQLPSAAGNAQVLDITPISRPLH